ncbi:Lon protease family protein [Halomonadaceae bacterium KBTZ08]
MTELKPLPQKQLYKACVLKELPFQNTDALEPLNEIVGQDRAREAVRFALAMPHNGYNVYALGRSGLGKRTMMLRYLAHRDEAHAPASDWCYVANYDDPRNPRVLKLPAGVGERLRHDVDRLVSRLVKVIPQAFDSDTYQSRFEDLKQRYAARQEEALNALAHEAREHGVDLSMSTPGGYRLTALNGNEPHTNESFNALSDEEKRGFEDTIRDLEKKLRRVMRQIAEWEEEHAEQQQKLNEETVEHVAAHLIDELAERYSEYEGVPEHFRGMKKDIADNLDIFLEDSEDKAAFAYASMEQRLPRRYRINLLVSRQDHSVPVVVEENPTYHNLFGFIETVTYKGTVYTDFSLIRPGSLHRANGGYLLMDATKVLEQGFVWDALKRAIRSREISIHSLERELTLSGTISLEPESVPLDVKIVLFGDRETWLLLQEYDPEFAELFRVTADFENEMPRTNESQLLYAKFIASLCQDKGLLPCSKQAVARVIEYSSRLAENQNRLSLHAVDIANVLREADFHARSSSGEGIERTHVEQALVSADYRNGRIRDEFLQGFADGSVLLSFSASAVGQVNGLSVLSTGGYEFGLPNRISATCQYGDGDIIHIERDVKLSGSIHSKGVMILSAWLSSLFAREHPMPLTATLTFEQSYAEIDGDSASLGELCAIVSVLAQQPARQDMAVTGSVNQHGEVQPVGGLNEKVEGFLDACVARGDTRDKAVILPASNVQNLMLAGRVREAVKEDGFRVYAVSRVEEALELILGVPAGTPDRDGCFPADSLYGRVEQRLSDLRRRQDDEKSD